MTLVDESDEEIIEACKSMKGLPYDGEPVDQLEHVLQCAALARAAGHDSGFVVAALLHDIARAPAVAGMPFDRPASTTARRARAGWSLALAPESPGWRSSTSQPSANLVATDPEYEARLSVVSRRTLIRQGGPMNEQELAQFRSNPDWRLALKLREVDDRGKVRGADVPGLEEYRDDIAAAAAQRRP